MRCLLDTHAFLWFDSAPEKLSEKALACLLNEDNELYLSHVGIWEMQIKTQLGKLSLDTPLKALIESQQATNAMQLLDIKPPHIYALEQLSSHHRDPFDRLLIAQAMTESMSLITVDEKIWQYRDRIDCLW